MRRLVTFVFLLVFTVPFGISISGCGSKTSVVFCNGGDSGPTTGTLTSITLTPRIYGVSLNFAQKGQTAAPAGSDCNGASVSPTGLLYSTTDMTVADVNPTTGALCGGNWNRNTGGGVADYTVCTSSGKQATAQITASAQGVTSNPLPVFVHSQVTSVALGAQSQDCSLDPATNCSPASASSGSTSTTCTVLPNGCCSAPVVTTNFSSNSCLSQGATGQLAARIFDGNGNNLSCVVGHLSYAPQTTSIVTINQDGVATAVAPARPSSRPASPTPAAPRDSSPPAPPRASPSTLPASPPATSSRSTRTPASRLPPPLSTRITSASPVLRCSCSPPRPQRCPAAVSAPSPPSSPAPAPYQRNVCPPPAILRR